MDKKMTLLDSPGFASNVESNPAAVLLRGTTWVCFSAWCFPASQMLAILYHLLLSTNIDTSTT